MFSSKLARRLVHAGRRLAAPVVAVVIALVMAAPAVAAAAPAPAATNPLVSIQPHSHRTGSFTKYVIVNWATNRCLDSNENQDLYTLPCNGGAYQHWDGAWDPSWPHGGGYLISDEATTFCLNGGGPPPRTQQCANNDNHEWHITGGTDAYQLRPDALVGVNNGGDYCLDSNANGDVYITPCALANPYQNWVVAPA
ncbi:ricin-type beta-trefoil lectin domain protein [Kutzneria buriramensis]|uniref:Ricin-type beta-trefoil lectin protein n=1 Tax=Kutzneria buriramensis TaxID=1045776 RepID=A0A3E0G4A8_9PSEU|nr:ricin-type beta-trefoil lectin domain protein [Kutzneria buriramensis]REH17408.1 ricin-type beta-trefoil lectin protein [Kutzneria buriramensis]